MIITVGKVTAQKASDFYKQQVCTVYNGYDTKPKKRIKPIKSNHMRFFYAGTLGPHRSPLLLIKCLSEYLLINQKIYMGDLDNLN